MKPADDIPGIGRFAILQDPQGASFAVIKIEAAQSLAKPTSDCHDPGSELKRANVNAQP